MIRGTLCPTAVRGNPLGLVYIPYALATLRLAPLTQG